jgi:hypothetical protein
MHPQSQPHVFALCRTLLFVASILLCLAASAASQTVAPHAKLYINDFNTTRAEAHVPAQPGPRSPGSRRADRRDRPPDAGFNFNNPSAMARFTSTDVITYDLTASGDGWRVDFTVVGTSADNEGVILTGYAIDGGPAGSGADSISITVRTATGTVLFTGTGTVSEGDVVIVR